MRIADEEGIDVGHEGRVVDEVQQGRVVLEDVEDARVRSLDVGHPIGRRAGFGLAAAAFHYQLKPFGEQGDVFLGEKARQHQVTAGLKRVDLVGRRAGGGLGGHWQLTPSGAARGSIRA